MEPCGTHACTSLGTDILSLTKALNFPLERKKSNKLVHIGQKFKIDNLCNKPGCHTVSKAFSISKNSAAVMQ
jgi:hypothetical protein